MSRAAVEAVLQRPVSDDEWRRIVAANPSLAGRDVAATATEGSGQWCGSPPPPIGPEHRDSNAPPLSEAEEQRRIRRDAIARGARVYWLSQARKTGQTPGIPDLFIAWPGRLALWWECKAQGGRRTAQQEQFAADVAGTGVHYGYGTHAEFLAWCEVHAP